MEQNENNKTERRLPVHIGLILDGNGRWAAKRGLPRTAGHTAGASNIRTITRYCRKIGIKYLTVYAFSTENWSRPAVEVEALMKLFHDNLVEILEDFRGENICVHFIGDRAPLSDSLKSLMKESEEHFSNRDGMVLNIALNYGGRMEIVNGVRDIARRCVEGTLKPDDINIDTISGSLYTAGQPDPDLIIRPSGEYRTSNFLLWQSAYAEYVFFDNILWPDFTVDDLERAIDIYSSRGRRFGGTQNK